MCLKVSTPHFSYLLDLDKFSKPWGVSRVKLEEKGGGGLVLSEYWTSHEEDGFR